MVLTVLGADKGTESSVRIESSLEGFDGLLARIAAEASKRGVALTPDTRANLDACGILADAGPA